jgi:hypothetical protein
MTRRTLFRLLIPCVLLAGALACRIVQMASPDGSTAAAPVTGLPEGTPSAPTDIQPVPHRSVSIEGQPYRAYQIPGDPFRFVCQEPCALSEEYIFAEYAGFRTAREYLIQLTGIDTLPELQPVDMHLELQDSVCDELPAGHANTYADAHQAYTCSEGPGYYPSPEEKIRMAAEPERQYFPLHEYMHTIFFGRLSGKAGDFVDYRAAFFHDYVVPVPSFAIGILNPAAFCSYHDPNPPGDYGGWLISELCRRNGFQLEDLALSLIELDRLYQSGEGVVPQEGYSHPAPAVIQYRDILNRLLGSDTTAAFAAACWPPQLFGNSFNVLPACVPETVSGTPTTPS